MIRSVAGRVHTILGLHEVKALQNQGRRKMCKGAEPELAKSTSFEKKGTFQFSAFDKNREDQN